MDFEKVVQVSLLKHPRKSDRTINYGTAGFRTKANYLNHVIYRMGLLAVLRSKCTKKAIGAMITASHNPEEDNGIKLVDPMGEMLLIEWEKYASQLANVNDEDIPSMLNTIVEDCNIDVTQPAMVIFARDTRPSSEELEHSLKDGVTALGGNSVSYGLLSTPQLHYMVCCTNTNKAYGEPTEQGYYHKLSSAFKTLRGQESGGKGSYRPEVCLDGANGIGALQANKLLPYLGDLLKLKIYNDGSSGKLNYQCGADFVKVQQTGPTGLKLDHGVRYVSFDGDADRIVFYYVTKDGQFRLLDGDKIATLVASYLKDLVAASGLKLELGLVQTAYANGSSTSYIRDKLCIPVACVPTGVKHLHHRAQQFDIGVYFEANGHGTVLFSDAALDQIIKYKADSSLGDAQKQAVRTLSAVVDLINQTIGDAISDLLLVETVLHSRGWDHENWNDAYTDLPNRQLKVQVKDRTVIETTDAERRTTSPAGLQEAIDEIVKKYKCGRSFVRPSGTEDVVRVYSEADSRENADDLAYEVSELAFKMAGGVGEPPNRT